MTCVAGFRQASGVGRISQGLAIFAMAFILGMIVHKGYNDVSALAEKHSGKQFWVALARYCIGNLAGGGKMPDDQAGR